MPPDLFIVAAGEEELYRYLREQFGVHEDVAVIMDRRVGERRRPPPHLPEPERRQGERRVRRQVDADLRSLGFAVIPINGGERGRAGAP